MTKLLDKIKKAELRGKGGASYPVYLKWEKVAKARSRKKFVICNASEGEPDVMKDEYIIEHHPEKLIEGMKLCMKEVSSDKAFLFINQDYYKKYSKRLKGLIRDDNIELFKKPHPAGYIAGEESSLINTIAGERAEPELKPPFPSTKGLYGAPTIVNNVETFYDVSLLNSNQFNNTRLYSITGDCVWSGVYEFADDETIEDILKNTNNYPSFEFFVQIGGGACGEVLNSDQLNRPVTGSGSITIYSKSKHKPVSVLKNWIDFFMNESCGKCTPCREGTYRLHEILKDKQPDWYMFFAILADLPETSFCALGKSVSIPVISYFQNVLKDDTKFSSIYNINKQ
ncbi:hypothetical protein C0584_00100 [Candidatus Parcubacteria bacterium]|nr:MAG: hypothetical protein C0584_00100 [Candidatus Parcubacteria bacterium]